MIDIHLNVRDVGGGDDLIEWDPANPGLVGSYRLKADGKWVSSSYDGLKSSWKVKRTPKQQYEVWAFGPQIGLGVHPPPPTGTFKTMFYNPNDYPLGKDASMGGNFYQQEKTADRASITTLGSEKVLRTRCAVGDTDVAGSGSGERCEIMRDSYAAYKNELTLTDGETIVFGTQFYIDPAFTENGFLYGTDYMAWCNFIQFHHGAGNSQVPWQLNLCTSSARLGHRIVGGGTYSGPYNQDGTPVGSTTEWWWGNTLNGGGNNAPAVTKGVWHTLVCSVKFSVAGTGHSKVWLDGNLVHNLANKKIGYSGDPGAYFKQGFYRAAGATGDATLCWRALYSFDNEADALAWYAA